MNSEQLKKIQKMFDAVEYFRDVATRLKEIQHTEAKRHFFRGLSMSRPSELEKSLSVACYPALVLIDRKDGRLTDRDSNNLLNKQLYSFMILKPASEQDPAAIETAVNDCQAIFKKIMSKMTRDKMADSRVDINNELTGLRNLERGDIAYQQVGPLLDNLYGLYVTFSIMDPLKAVYSEGDWLVSD